MPIDNKPPFYDTKVSKFPLPGAHNKPGVVYVAKDCEPKDFLMAVMKDTQQPWDRRCEAARALLPFCHTVKPVKRT